MAALTRAQLANSCHRFNAPARDGFWLRVWPLISAAFFVGLIAGLAIGG